YTSRGESGYNRLTASQLKGHRRAGYDAVRLYVSLREHRLSHDLPASVLDDLAADVETARAAEMPLIVRPTYSPNGQRPSDPPLERVLRHIEQLGPVMRAGRDVIAYVEAGMIGRWGEWHESATFSAEWDY